MSEPAPAPALFVALPLSPFSEKARWALDHHRVAYEERPYTPMLSAPALRWRLRRARGQVSVPVLFAGDEVHTDSFDIAQYAERRGSGAPLFRRGQEAEVDRWNQVSERAMAAGRGLIICRAADDRDARQELLPPFVPRALRRPLRSTTLLALRYLDRKYGSPGDETACRAELRAVLLELRRALADGRRYLLGELSYADVAMAPALQAVQPVDPALAPHLRLGKATRRIWTDLELAGELTDLVEWRDQIYAKHRAPRGADGETAARPAAPRASA